jgi:hypothetical protein
MASAPGSSVLDVEAAHGPRWHAVRSSTRYGLSIAEIVLARRCIQQHRQLPRIVLPLRNGLKPFSPDKHSSASLRSVESSHAVSRKIRSRKRQVMSDYRVAVLNQEVWDAWIARGRRSDGAFSQRVRLLALAVGSVALLAASFWTLI